MEHPLSECCGIYKRKEKKSRIKLLSKQTYSPQPYLYGIAAAIGVVGFYLGLITLTSDWHMGPGMMGSWGMGGFGMIFMMVFWALAIAGLIFLVKWLVQATKGDKGRKLGGSLGAIEILKQRYARGEIDKAEFESKKRTLEDIRTTLKNINYPAS